MNRDQWIWMPHPAHLIVSQDCRFHLATYLPTGHIVSTVGEWLPDAGAREIFADTKGIKLKGKGDERRYSFINQHGFVEIAAGRKYETMVFTAKAGNDCCPWQVANHEELDCAGYNDAGEAYRGHLAMCEKWATGGTA